MSKLNHGTIVVEVGSNTYTLKPTLRAARAIESRFGGILPALTAIGNANVSLIAVIIAAGAGIDTNKRKEVERVEEDVFEGGVVKVGNQVAPFIKALLNPGGKTDEELAEASDQGNESQEASSTNSSD